MINPDALLTLDQFRTLRDFYAWDRRRQALPQLKAQKSALKREIIALHILADWLGQMPTKGLAWQEFQKAVSNNHKREQLLSAALELSVDYQYVSGQVAVIEREQAALTARVPERLRVQIFELKGAA